MPQLRLRFSEVDAENRCARGTALNEIFHLFNWGYRCLGMTSEIHLFHLQLSSPDALPPLFTALAGRGDEKCKCRGAERAAGVFCPLVIGGVHFSQLSEHDALSGMDVVGMIDFFPIPGLRQTDGCRGKIEFPASGVLEGDMRAGDPYQGDTAEKHHCCYFCGG